MYGYRSILITDEDVEVNRIGFGVPWNGDTAAYNMKRPKESVNINNYEENDWINSLGDLNEISYVFIGCDMENYDFLNDFKNLRQLYMYTAKNLKSIDFISDKIMLNDLCIIDSQVSNLTPLAELLKKQKEIQKKILDSYEGKERIKIFDYKLENLAIVDSEISDLSPLSGIKNNVSELILKGNSIEDLEPISNLASYYFDISHNKVSELERYLSVRKSYLVNARWNRIRSVEFMRDKLCAIARFFVKHNEIEDYTPLKGHHFVDSDVSYEECGDTWGNGM